MERVELDLVDLAFGVFGAIDCALDRIAKLADIARPGLGFELVLDRLREARPV